MRRERLLVCATGHLQRVQYGLPDELREPPAGDVFDELLHHSDATAGVAEDRSRQDIDPHGLGAVGVLAVKEGGQRRQLSIARVARNAVDGESGGMAEDAPERYRLAARERV